MSDQSEWLLFSLMDISKQPPHCLKIHELILILKKFCWILNCILENLFALIIFQNLPRCSKIWCICQLFLHHCKAGHANEETMQLLLQLPDARWISLMLFDNCFCSISRACYHFHLKLVTAHLDSTSIRILLVCVLLA